MDDSTLTMLLSAGAAARAAGATLLDNPMYRTENVASAESNFELWAAKATAWESGWYGAEPLMPTPLARHRRDFSSLAED
jgi:hypothetical protein